MSSERCGVNTSVLREGVVQMGDRNVRGEGRDGGLTGDILLQEWGRIRHPLASKFEERF